MRDGSTARAALRELCDRLSSAAALGIVRFRRATLGSVGRDAFAAISDSILHDEHGAVDGNDDRRPLGLALVASRADGGPIAHVEVHPAEDDLEGFVTSLALDTSARIGCVVELRAEQVVVERLVGTRGVQCRPSAEVAATFAGLRVECSHDAARVRLVHETPPAHPALALLTIVLALVFWWLVLLGLLFRSGREAISAIARQTLRRRPSRWQAELGPATLVVIPADAPALTLPLDRVRCVSLASRGWTSRTASGPPALRFLVDGRFVEVDVPSELRAALAAALRGT